MFLRAFLQGVLFSLGHDDTYLVAWDFGRYRLGMVYDSYDDLR